MKLCTYYLKYFGDFWALPSLDTSVVSLQWYCVVFFVYNLTWICLAYSFQWKQCCWSGSAQLYSSKKFFFHSVDTINLAFWCVINLWYIFVQYIFNIFTVHKICLTTKPALPFILRCRSIRPLLSFMCHDLESLTMSSFLVKNNQRGWKPETGTTSWSSTTINYVPNCCIKTGLTFWRTSSREKY